MLVIGTPSGKTYMSENWVIISWGIVMNWFFIWRKVEEIFTLSIHSQNKSYRYFKYFLIQDKHAFILHSQYHGCWWSGGSRIQGINSHGVDLVFPNYFTVITRRSKLLPLFLWCEAVRIDKWCMYSLSHNWVFPRIVLGNDFALMLEGK